MKETRLKWKGNSKVIRIVVFMFIVLLGLATLVFSLNFVSNPQINSGDTVYTANDLVCSWQASADATSTNVTWYKDDVAQFTFSVAGNTSNVTSSNTTKNEEWTCEVKLYNATNSLFQNVSANISNTLPTNPKLFNLSGFDVGNSENIVEDTVYYYIFNATDDDGDTLLYSTNAGSFCSLNIDENTGNVTCSPTNDDLDDPHTVKSKLISFIPDDLGVGEATILKINFSVIPVNDQAEFAENLLNVSVPADTPWSVFVNGTDEELDYPLIFTISSGIDATYPGLIIVDQINSFVANLTFNTSDNAPNNNHVGNWTVNINITDNASSNATRPPTQMNLIIEITTTNHPPQFITGLNNTNGTQNQAFLAIIYANDSDPGDNLSFNITNPSNPNETCSEPFPWSISVLDDNGSNASGQISVTLNNTHVICRYITVTVSDERGATTSILVFINVTNVNDPPKMFEIGKHGNMSVQSTYLYTSYQYMVNASDIDNLTYDYLGTGTLTYYINDTSILSIDFASGLITGNPTNSSDAGNYTINITAGDGEYNVSRIMSIGIIDNIPPILNLTTNNFNLSQNQTILINFTSLDPDNGSMSVNFTVIVGLDESAYNIYKVANNYSGGENLATWTLNMSTATAKEANDLVGNHSLQINISDELNASQEGISTGFLNFTIENVNDAPFFDTDSDNSSDNISFTTIIVNRQHNILINATDFDLFVATANELLNYSYSNATANMTQINLTKITNNQVFLSFVVTDSINQSIVLTVTDLNGSSVSQNISFEVFLNSTPPVFHEIRPYYNFTLDNTIFAMGNATPFIATNTVTINITENNTILFDAIVENDTSIANNNLTFRWYFNNTLNETILNALPGINSNKSFDFDFFSNGTNYVKLEAVDSRFSATNWTWIVNTTNINRPPVLVNPLDNITVNLSTTFNNYLSYRSSLQRFYDPDDDLNSDGIRSVDFGENGSLAYEIINVASCSFIETSISGDDFSVVPSATGICELRILATDTSNESVISNIVRVNVIGSEPNAGEETPSSSSGGSSTRTQVITVPFEEEVDVPAPIELIAPGRVDTYVNKTIEISITIRNTWTEAIRGVSLSGIALNATFFDEPNASIVFSQNYFSTIPVGGEYETILTLSNYRSAGPFEITIFASVQKPEFTDSATILINSLEQSSEGDEVKSKVTFAKDMISENPECRELNDLLNRAEKELNLLNYKESLNLVNAVINGCKYLISNIEDSRRESPSIIEVTFDFVGQHSTEIVTGAGILTVLTIIIYAIAGIRKFIQERD